MALPTDFTPLETRVYEVLCQGRGVYRTITAGRFRPRLYPGQRPDNQHKEGMAASAAAGGGTNAGLIFAIVETYGDGGTQEFSDRAHINARLRVDVAYATPNPTERSASAPTVDLISAALTGAASDAHAIRSALCWPPNMVTTQGGADTGIAAGGGISFAGFGPVRFDEANQLVTVTIFFQIVAFLAFPTSVPFSLDLPSMVLSRGSEGSYLTAAPTDGSSPFMAWAGPNVLRIENRGDGASGLALLERASTNLILYSRDIKNPTAWAVPGGGLVTTSGQPGSPDGAWSATEINISSGGFSLAQAFSYSQPIALSGWAIAKSGTPTWNGYFNALRQVANVALVTTQWRRGVGLIGAGSSTAGWYLVDAADWGSGALDGLFDLVQAESGRYPTSAIRTTGAQATRAADTLTLSTAPSWMTDGAHAITIAQVSPIFANTDLVSGDVRWLFTFGGANDGVRIRHTGVDIRVEAVQGNVVKASSGALTFAQHGLLGTVKIDPVAAKITVNGVTGATGTVWNWTAAPAGLRVGGIYGGSGSEADCRLSTTWTST